MTVQLSAAQRRALSEAKAKVREIMDPVREAERIKRAKDRKARERAVKPAEGQRKPRVTLTAYRKLVGRLFCIATLIRTGQEAYGVEVAHLRFSTAEHGPNPGMQRKNHDFHVTPLSREEHRRQHAMKEADYWGELGVPDPYRLAKDVHAAAPDLERMAAVLREAAAMARGRRR